MFTTRSALLFVAPLMFLIGCDGSLFAQSFKAASESMAPTIEQGETFTVVPAKDTAPPRGTVVVFEKVDAGKKTLTVSRVIAVAGDRIGIVAKEVYLNEESLEEPYAVFRDPRTFPNKAFLSETTRKRDHLLTMTVPEEHVFLMGDNRDYSFDSRFYGPVPIADIRGTVKLEAE